MAVAEPELREKQLKNQNDSIQIQLPHFTPQQLSKLINLHIKTKQCINVKCQQEKQQLQNTIAKLAKLFYDVYVIHEKQRRELHKIVNFYNDFCAQFALPNRIQLPGQQENAKIDKTARMIYDHFICQNGVKKNSVDQNRTSDKNYLAASVSTEVFNNTATNNRKRQKSGSSNSIIALENKPTSSGIHEEKKRKKIGNALTSHNGSGNHGSMLATCQSSSANKGSINTPSNSSLFPPTPNNLGVVVDKRFSSNVAYANDMVKASGERKLVSSNLCSPMHSIPTTHGLLNNKHLIYSNTSNRETRKKTIEERGNLECYVINSKANQLNGFGGTALIARGKELSPGLINSLHSTSSNGVALTKQHHQRQILISQQREVIQLEDED